MTSPPICNYEGSRYRTEFWTPARAYEDGAERIALRAMLPPRGRTLIEVGAGYGRLADLYSGYDHVVLLDYARTQLEQALARLGAHGPGGRPTYTYVQANFYHLPFVAGLFDTVVMVRTLHHAADAPAVLRGLSTILRPGGVLILEFANKRNLKAILRYLLKRQTWSPFDPAPVEFVPLNFDFHPAWIRAELERAGLRREMTRAVSYLRLPWLKHHLPTSWLLALDAILQPTGQWLPLSPSTFVRARTGRGRRPAPAGTFFRCPACGAPLGTPSRETYTCPHGHTWRREGLIYDFRHPPPTAGTQRVGP